TSAGRESVPSPGLPERVNLVSNGSLKPAAVISFFASPGSNLYHLAFSPNAFVSFGSSQLGSPAPKQLCQAEGDSRPCLRKLSTLPNVSTYRSRSVDIDTALRTRSSRKGEPGR